MVKGMMARGPLSLAATVCLLAVMLAGPSAWAGDAFVLLSGGGTPFSNNYSQYLQAKAVAGYFMSHYPPESVWVFFGAGNLEGHEPIISDVRRQIKHEGLLLESWLAGPLDRNRPARRDVFMAALREEILPAVAEGGTLFLFVGDHGSETGGNLPESTINLWEWEPDPSSERGWRSTKDDSLAVGELRDVLARGMGRGRIVFCMTQCHSGGFHYLAMPTHMSPNPKWFSRAPEWMASFPPPPRALPIAGYTATDQKSPAAGCDPAPDPDTWAGYERFFPESLLGVDLFTMEKKDEGMRSFAEAHEVATLQDRTIDKPCATSEQYLERWATLIETRLVGESHLKWSVKRRVVAYQRKVDGLKPTDRNPQFRQRQALFQRFTQRLIEQNPNLKSLLLDGTRRDLEEVIDPNVKSSGGRTERTSAPQDDPAQPSQRSRNRRGRGPGSSEARRAWNETLRPAWRHALEDDQVAGLAQPVREFELHLLSLDSETLSYPSGRTDALREEIYWFSGHGHPQTLDPLRNQTLARWLIERRRAILDWARDHQDEAIRAAGDRLAQSRPRRPPDAPATEDGPAQTGQAPPASKPEPEEEESPAPEIAAARVLFYRRVLAAWEFLLDVKEVAALERLGELIELERTSLPTPVLRPPPAWPGEQLEAGLKNR